VHAFQLLLNPEMVKACPTLIPYVYDFLENKAYSKGKGEFARKVIKFIHATDMAFGIISIQLQNACSKSVWLFKNSFSACVLSPYR